MTDLQRIAALVALASLASACAATSPGRGIERTGFLEDYSILEEGGKNEAQKRWISPDADFSQYDKIMLLPITFWRAPGSDRKLDPEDRQRLLNNFYRMMHASLSQDWTMVDTAQPGAVSFQIAITEADASNVTLDTMSSVVPQMRILTSAQGYVSGKPAFVGQAQIEFKMKDAETGEMLLVGADRRVGTKSISGSTNKWSDVDNAMKYWSEIARYRLCVLRGRTGCPEPGEQDEA